MIRGFNHGIRLALQNKGILPKGFFGTKAKSVKVTFKMDPPNGSKTVDAVLGQSLWETAHNNGIPLEGACEGNCGCGTCHIILKEDIVKKLPPMKPEEKELLDSFPNKTSGSRLACQILVNEILNKETVLIPSQTM